jgi:hypothetical protein
MPKGARLVVEAQQSEALEERRRLDVWSRAISGLLTEDPDLEATGASRPRPTPTPVKSPVAALLPGSHATKSSRPRSTPTPAQSPIEALPRNPQATRSSRPRPTQNLVAAPSRHPQATGASRPCQIPPQSAPPAGVGNAERAAGKRKASGFRVLSQTEPGTQAIAGPAQRDAAPQRDPGDGAEDQAAVGRAPKRSRFIAPGSEAGKVLAGIHPVQSAPEVWRPKAPAAEVTNRWEAVQKPAKGKAKLKARRGGLEAPPTSKDGPLQPDGGSKARKGGAKAGKVGKARVMLPGGLETTQEASKEVETLGVAIKEGLREQDSAQTTQGKASIVHQRRGIAEMDDDLSRERQSKNAAENLADCLAEIDEFFKDS